MSAYPKEAEWRLGNLHIHKPASYNYRLGEFAGMTPVERSDAIKQVIKNINESDASVYAINDYWTFDGYLALRAAMMLGISFKRQCFQVLR